MTIAVLLRAVFDPTVEGGTYDGHHVLDGPSIVAIHLARQFRKQARGETILGIGAGPREWETPLRTALALECDRVVRPWPADGKGDAAASSVIEAARLIAASLPADTRLVVAGEASTDHGTGVLAAAIAECLGWPFVANAGTVASEGSDRCLVTVRSGGGKRTLLRVTGPVVVSAARMPTPALYPRVASLIAARRQAIPAGPAPARPGRGGVTVVGYGPERPSTRHLLQPSANANPAQRLRQLMSGGMSNRNGEKLGGAGPDIARQLTALLAKEGFIA
jgi:electron transfer flavoprotein beta subunit